MQCLQAFFSSWQFLFQKHNCWNVISAGRKKKILKSLIVGEFYTSFVVRNCQRVPKQSKQYNTAEFLSGSKHWNINRAANSNTLVEELIDLWASIVQQHKMFGVQGCSVGLQRDIWAFVWNKRTIYAAYWQISIANLSPLSVLQKLFSLMQMQYAFISVFFSLSSWLHVENVPVVTVHVWITN